MKFSIPNADVCHEHSLKCVRIKQVICIYAFSNGRIRRALCVRVRAPVCVVVILICFPFWLTKIQILTICKLETEKKNADIWLSIWQGSKVNLLTRANANHQLNKLETSFRITQNWIESERARERKIESNRTTSAVIKLNGKVVFCIHRINPNVVMKRTWYSELLWFHFIQNTCFYLRCMNREKKGKCSSFD